MSVPVSAATDKHLKAVIGPQLYAQREFPLLRSLQGERVEFEVESDALGVHRHLQTVVSGQ